jgi:hypothetical protein
MSDNSAERVLDVNPFRSTLVESSWNERATKTGIALDQ